MKKTKTIISGKTVLRLVALFYFIFFIGFIMERILSHREIPLNIILLLLGTSPLLVLLIISNRGK
ncbi:hypothetical protein [Streptococcus macacae]|uniref:Uncharacterized protein n=1 Tax=Streptococcus macacae NCTC 11558 TaxID=764298 RepID=G5JW57_9STRE|nr:hypothetical protein [Streptococcus macacae]EHJ51601.1 hypothetical protein STRMA_1471 [Streptococcus macacae NCTC 11558]SUN79399.1 Uncharacterised protein [Streptococcus macacae NCTC 11558]